MPQRLDNIAFRSAAGTTEVVIVTDGTIPSDGFEVVRVAEPPARQVIKIFGPTSSYTRDAIAVGSEHVRRLRTGLHRINGRDEVHIVADLTGPAVELLGTDVRGTTLVVVFGTRR